MPTQYSIPVPDAAALSLELMNPLTGAMQNQNFGIWCSPVRDRVHTMAARDLSFGEPGRVLEAERVGSHPVAGLSSGLMSSRRCLPLDNERETARTPLQDVSARYGRNTSLPSVNAAGSSAAAASRSTCNARRAVYPPAQGHGGDRQGEAVSDDVLFDFAPRSNTLTEPEAGPMPECRVQITTEDMSSAKENFDFESLHEDGRLPAGQLLMTPAKLNDSGIQASPGFDPSLLDSPSTFSSPGRGLNGWNIRGITSSPYNSAWEGGLSPFRQQRHESSSLLFSSSPLSSFRS